MKIPPGTYSTTDSLIESGESRFQAIPNPTSLHGSAVGSRRNVCPPTRRSFTPIFGLPRLLNGGRNVEKNISPRTKWCAILISCVLLIPARGGAQTDTVDVPSDRSQGEGRLNDSVAAAVARGTLSNTVFRLELNGRYILESTVVVPAGNRLTIIAPDPRTTPLTAPPMILWNSRDGTIAWHNFDCFGDIALKNVWLLYADTSGRQCLTSLIIEDSPDTIHGQHATFDGVLFDYAGIGPEAGGAVTVAAGHFRGMFTNCYFRNCTDETFPWYGRAVSFPFNTPGCHTDSLTFENCTFANLGYVYMQEDGNYADVVRFNHCTFVNVMVFALESGWWHWLSVTNCVFANMFLYGDALGMRPSPSEPFGGTLRIDSISTFGFPVPFTEADRHILFSHSSYFIEDWVREYMAGFVDTNMLPPGGIRPQPMLSPGTLGFFDDAANGRKSFPLMIRSSLHDSTNPAFVLPPTNHEGIRRFVWMNWNGAADTSWAFYPEEDVVGTWPLAENLKFTNLTLRQAGMYGLPLGDLYHWFPDIYTQWKAGVQREDGRISYWLQTGIDPEATDAVRGGAGSPSASHFTLSQNYPNPFNPTTAISFELPAVSHVTLRVYDLLGREVKTLVEGFGQPGSHTVTFDGGNLASGVYFYQLRAQGYILTKKLMVLK
jgi:hypothetical protein